MGWTCSTFISCKLCGLMSMHVRMTQHIFLRRSSAAHFEVVWPHEQVGNAFAHHPQDPLIKVLGLCLRHLVRHFGIDEACEALDLQSTADTTADCLTAGANAGSALSMCCSNSADAPNGVLWVAPDPLCPGR
jgi:hypothetical protein